MNCKFRILHANSLCRTKARRPIADIRHRANQPTTGSTSELAKDKTRSLDFRFHYCRLSAQLTSALSSNNIKCMELSPLSTMNSQCDFTSVIRFHASASNFHYIRITSLNCILAEFSDVNVFCDVFRVFRRNF